MEHVIAIVGENRVAFGTDFTDGHGAGFFEWITRGKGNARTLVEFGEIANPKGASRSAGVAAISSDALSAEHR